MQDTRGRYGSQGGWEPLVREYDDGYDTVRWAARLPDGDGRVAMYGSGYLGHAQGASDDRDGLVFEVVQDENGALMR